MKYKKNGKFLNFTLCLLPFEFVLKSVLIRANPWLIKKNPWSSEATPKIFYFFY